jgi:hypothetical protein
MTLFADRLENGNYLLKNGTILTPAEFKKLKLLMAEGGVTSSVIFVDYSLKKIQS